MNVCKAYSGTDVMILEKRGVTIWISGLCSIMIFISEQIS
jgi:hypothetical protein